MEPVNDTTNFLSTLPMPPFLTDMEVDLSAGTAAVANSTNSACRATYSEPLSEPLPMSRSTSGTHTSIRATPYSRETFLKLCSYSKLLGVPVLTEPLCSHVECWGMGRHIENAIHVPIREGDPYQVGDVLDAVSARGCQILRFDVYPWRYAENVDIIEIIGKPPFIETNVSCTPKKTLPISSFSGSSQNSGHNDKLLFNSSISSDMNDSYDIERVRNEQEDDEDESDDDDEDEDDEYSKGDSESVGNIKNENNNNTRHQLQQQQKQQQHQQPRPLFELVTSGIQVLGHPVQVLRPKSRFDHLWKVKIRGWDSSRPLSELYVGLNKTFGKARQVVELELLGIKTKRTFWPSGNILLETDYLNTCFWANLCKATTRSHYPLDHGLTPKDTTSSKNAAILAQLESQPHPPMNHIGDIKLPQRHHLMCKQSHIEARIFAFRSCVQASRQYIHIH